MRKLSNDSCSLYPLALETSEMKAKISLSFLSVNLSCFNVSNLVFSDNCCTNVCRVSAPVSSRKLNLFFRILQEHIVIRGGKAKLRGLREQNLSENNPRRQLHTCLEDFIQKQLKWLYMQRKCSIKRVGIGGSQSYTVISRSKIWQWQAYPTAG